MKAMLQEAVGDGGCRGTCNPIQTDVNDGGREGPESWREGFRRKNAEQGPKLGTRGSLGTGR